MGDFQFRNRTVSELKKRPKNALKYRKNAEIAEKNRNSVQKN